MLWFFYALMPSCRATKKPYRYCFTGRLLYVLQDNNFLSCYRRRRQSWILQKSIRNQAMLVRQQLVTPLVFLQERELGLLWASLVWEQVS